MLNLHNRISLSRKVKRSVKEFWKRQHGSLGSQPWGSITNPVKSEISKKVLFNQRYQCVYCERYLYGQSPELDHFASKASYPRFTFNPINIFYSCHFCNSPERKGVFDTVLIYNARYDQCMFSILHPLLDDIDSQLVYQDNDKIVFDWNGCSQSARDTIVALMLDDYIMTTIRSRDLRNQRLNPLASDSEIELIQLSIAYKP